VLKSNCRITSNAKLCKSNLLPIRRQPPVTVNPIPPDPIITKDWQFTYFKLKYWESMVNSAGLIPGATSQNYSPPPSNDNYYVRVTINGCISAISNIISFFNWIEKNKLYKGISIFPNPAQNSLTIENKNFIKPINFEIISSEGKKVYYSMLHYKSIIDLDQFSSGIYFIRFFEENSYYLLKFIKE